MFNNVGHTTLAVVAWRTQGTMSTPVSTGVDEKIRGVVLVCDPFQADRALVYRHRDTSVCAGLCGRMGAVQVQTRQPMAAAPQRCP